MPAITTMKLADRALALAECDTTRPCDATCAMCHALGDIGRKVKTDA